MWPFAGGSSRPSFGVPVGQDINTGSTVCCDKFSWFKAGLISSASMSVFGLNGYGKSSFVIRQTIGEAAMGICPIFAGDLKGEYSHLVRALGGTVLNFDESFRYNVLDLGAMAAASRRLTGLRAEELRQNAEERATNMVATLIGITRRSRVLDFEHSLLTAAIRILHEKADPSRPPTLPDLLRLTSTPTQELQRVALTGNDEEEYRVETRGLNRSLQAILDGPLGRTFSGQSTARLDLDAPALSIDISAVSRRSDDVLAAVMLATWSEVFASIEAANALADAGVARQRYFDIVLDEIWRGMRLDGAGLVDAMDSMTRLNRNDGIGNTFVMHSLKDPESLASAADVKKAQGFAERSGIVVTAALTEEDLRSLSNIKRMSEKEIRTVSSWSTPPGWQAPKIKDPVTGEERPAPPPDAGKVLIKLGQRAGIPTQVKLTPTELALHDTNARWVTGGQHAASSTEEVA